MAAEGLWGEPAGWDTALKVYSRSGILQHSLEVGFVQAQGCSCMVSQAKEMNLSPRAQVVNKLKE